MREPLDDDFPADLTTPAMLEVGVVSQGRIDPAFDADFWRVDLAAGIYTFNMRPDFESDDPLRDPFAFVFSAGGVLQNFNDDRGDGSLNARVWLQVFTDRTVFVSAEAFSDRTGDYRLSVNPVLFDEALFELALVDTVTGLRLAPIPPGGVVDVSDIDLAFATIVAAPTAAGAALGEIGAVQFDLNNRARTGFEQIAPFALLGDNAAGRLNRDPDFAAALEARNVLNLQIFSTTDVEDPAVRFDERVLVARLVYPFRLADAIAADAGTDAALNPGEAALGVIDFGGDVDWWRMTVEAGRAYAVAAQSLDGVFASVTVLDADGDEALSGSQGIGGGEEAFFAPTGDDDLFAVVDGSVGDYVLSLREIADDAPAGPETTRSLGPRSPAFGVFETFVDEDWFALDASVDGPLLITLAALDDFAVDAFTGPSVSLVTAAGEALGIASLDINGLSGDVRLLVDAPVDGPLFVAVNAVGYSGGYSLAVEEVAPSRDALTVGLYDVRDNALLTVIEDGDALPASALLGRNLTVAATVDIADPYFGEVGSITLDLADNLFRRTENVAPYALFGDDRGDFQGPALTARQLAELGTVELDLIVTSGRFGHGEVLDVVTRSFTVVDDLPPDVPGDVTTTAAIAVGETVAGALEVEGDRDWFVFEAPEEALYSVGMSGFFTNGAGLSDPFLRLRDEAGALLAVDDDSGPGLDSLLTVRLDAGRYFLEAGAFADASSGDYDLFVAA